MTTHWSQGTLIPDYSKISSSVRVNLSASFVSGHCMGPRSALSDYCHELESINPQPSNEAKSGTARRMLSLWHSTGSEMPLHKCAAVPRRARIQSSQPFASHKSRLESNTRRREKRLGPKCVVGHLVYRRHHILLQGLETS